MEKSVQYGGMRYRLQHALLELANYDYQLEEWCDPERKTMPNYAGVTFTLEALIEDFAWDDLSMIGSVLRSEQERIACLAVFVPALEMCRRLNDSWVDEDYIFDPAWPHIIAASRHALRVLLQGDL
jgi:hypothetical protein